MERESHNMIEHESLNAKDYFEQYWRYCSSLRNWFVAYGIGGCILFLSDKAALFQKMALKQKRAVVIAFFIGVIAQVLLAGLNKCIHWNIYWGKEDQGFSKTWRYKFSIFLSTKFCIDVVVDLITFGAFGIATAILVISFFPVTTSP